MSRLTAVGTAPLSCPDEDGAATIITQAQLEQRASVILYAIGGTLLACMPITAIVAVLAQ